MAEKAKIGASIVLDGEKEFKAAVTACNKSLSGMKSELGLVKEKYADNANSLEALRAKHDVLSNTLDAQKAKVEATKSAYDHAVASQSKVSAGLEKLRADYESANQKMEQMKNSGNATDKELADQEKTVKNLADAIKRGERNYETAENRVLKWKSSLNTAETQMIKANRALDENDRYMREAESATDKCATSINAYGRTVKSAEAKTSTFGDVLKANLTGAAIINGVRTLTNGIKSVGEAAVNSAKDVGLYADDMNTLATQTGVSTDTLQELKYMEDLVDVSLETVTGSMARNIRSMSKAKQGSDIYVKAYKDLGVSIKGANGELRDSEEVYWDIIDALGNVENETERNAMSMTIFGKSAQDLNPLVAQGSEGINALKKEAQDCGAVLSTDTLNAMNEVNDQFDRMKGQSDALKREIGVELAPSVLSAATEIGNAIKENKDELIGLASDGMDAVAVGLTWIIEHAHGVVAGVTAITGAFIALKAASAASNFASGIGALASMATPIGATVAVVGLLASGIAALTIENNKATTALQKKADAEKNDMTAMSQKQEQLSTNIKQTKDNMNAVKGETSTVSHLVSRLKELNPIQNKTSEQKKEIWRISEKLKGSIPEVAAAFDDETGSVKLTVKQIDKLAESYKKSALAAAAQQEMSEAAKQAVDAETGLNDAKLKMDEWEAKKKAAEEKEREAMKNNNYYGLGYHGKELRDAEKDVDAATKAYKKYEEQVKAYQKDQTDANAAMDEAQKLIDKYSDALQKGASDGEGASDSAKKSAKQYDNVSNALKKSKTLLSQYGMTVSSSTQKAFDKAVNNAKKTGTDIPKGLSSGLKSGKKTAEDAVMSINGAIKKKFESLAKLANKAGVDVPKKLTSGVKNGTVDVVSAYDKINNQLTKLSEKQKDKMKKAGIPITKEMKEAYKNGGSDAAKTIDDNNTTLRDLMKKSGVNSVAGLVEGLKEKKPEVIQAYTDLGLDADKAFKNSLDIHSPSRKMRQSGVYTVEGLIQGIESKKGKAKKSANELGELLNTAVQNKIDMKSLKNFDKGYSQASITKYWQDVTKATKKGTSAHIEALKNYYQARNDLLTQKKEYISNLQTSYKEKLSELNESINTAKEEYKEAVKSTQDSISGMWGMFSNAETSKTNNADGLIRNMKNQSDTISAWAQNLNTLRQRGLSADLISDLQSAGVSSAGDVSTLTSMTQAQLAQYQYYYSQRNAASKREAEKENAELKATTDKQVSTYSKQLVNLKRTTKKKLDSFQASFKNRMKELGKNTADGFAKGLTEGNNSVVKAIAQMTGSTVAQVKKNLGIHSPSKVMDELGGYTGLGFANGLTKETQNLSDIITGALPSSVSAPSVSGVSGSATSSNASSSGMAQVNLIIDSKMIGSAIYRQIDLMQGTDILLKQRGLVR